MNNSASEAAETDRLCGSSVFPHCSVASPPRIRYMRFGDEGELGGRRGGGEGWVVAVMGKRRMGGWLLTDSPRFVSPL